MNIFDKRPLSLILCIWLGGFVFFSRGTSLVKTIIAVLAILLLAAYLLLLIRKNNKIIIALSAIALLTSITTSQIVFGLIYNPTERFTGESTLVGTVSDVSRGSYSASITLKIETVNDESYRNRYILLRLSNTQARDIGTGDKITVTGKFYDFESSADFDSKSYYFSNSICAEISDVTDIKIERSDKEPLSSKLATMREYLRRRTVMFSNSDAGSMTAALLFGERSALSDQTRLNFTRIGISHLLALSGLHLAIICIGLSGLLGLFRINKKLKYLLSIIFVIAYMAFTGFSVSVLRAGIMLIVTYTLFLLAKTHDSITSLSIAVFIICIVSPFSIYDISLWLSALATLGLLVLYEALDDKAREERLAKSIFRYIGYSILTSVFAITATMLISTVTFDTISVIAPISNLVLSFFAEIVMLLGSATLLIGGIIPIGKLLIPVVDLMNKLAELLAEPRWVYVSTDFILMKILIILITVAFIIFAVTNIKHKRRYLLLLASFFIAISITAVAINEASYSNPDIIYSSSVRSDIILIKSQNQVCLVNSSQFNKSSATKACKLLQEEHITQLDKYVVTGYTRTIADDVCELLSTVSTKEIYVPSPRSDEESDICEMLYASIVNFNTKLVIYNIDNPIFVGDYSVQRDYASIYGEAYLCSVRIYGDSCVYTYLSSGMTLCEDYPLKENLSTSDIVIYGGYGYKVSEEFYIDHLYDKNKKIILNTENVYFDDKTYSKYKENGCEIYPHPSKISIFTED